METLKLEFVVKDGKGNVLATHELDYVDEYNLASRYCQQRITNVAVRTIEDAKREEAKRSNAESR